MFPPQEARKTDDASYKEMRAIAKGLLAEKTKAPKPNEQRRMLLETAQYGIQEKMSNHNWQNRTLNHGDNRKFPPCDEQRKR